MIFLPWPLSEIPSLDDDPLPGVAVLRNIVLVQFGERRHVGCVDAVHLFGCGGLHLGHGDGGTHDDVDRPPEE